MLEAIGNLSGSALSIDSVNLKNAHKLDFNFFCNAHNVWRNPLVGIVVTQHDLKYFTKFTDTPKDWFFPKGEIFSFCPKPEGFIIIKILYLERQSSECIFKRSGIHYASVVFAEVVAVQKPMKGILQSGEIGHGNDKGSVLGD